jgi:hypothetical protein
MGLDSDTAGPRPWPAPDIPVPHADGAQQA